MYKSYEGKEVALFISLFLSLVGISLIAMGVIVMRHSIKLKKKCTAKAVAKIQEITTKIHDDSFHDYAIIKYQANGKYFTSKVPISRSIFSSPKVGQTIQIKYNPKARSQCYVAGEDLKGHGAGFIAIGGSMLIGAIFILFTNIIK